MIGKVQMDSFHGLGIRTPGDFADSFGFEPLASPTSTHSTSGEPFLLKECPVVVGSGRPSSLRLGFESPSQSPVRPVTPSNQQNTSSSRYKTEMCRPFQEHGVCKYGEKCQFAHGENELRSVQRHPKYKTDMCRTYHSVGFCPYGPRCHFIHSLDEMRLAPAAQNGSGAHGGAGNSPDKRGAVGPHGLKQLPMFGGSLSGSSSDTDGGWPSFADSRSGVSGGLFGLNSNSSSHQDPSMKSAVAQLNKYFNMNGANNSSAHHNSLVGGLSPLGGFSLDSSRSGSFSSDGESSSHSPSSASPPPDSLCTSPIDVSRSLRLPIFSRLA